MKGQEPSNTNANPVFIGYWINPEGKYIGIEHDPFKTIWANSEEFALSKQAMEELYQKYLDESSVIQEIINYQLERGWVYTIFKKKYWMVYANTFNRKTADRLWEWAYNSLSGILSERDPFERVKIYFSADQVTLKTDLAEMLLGGFVEGFTSLSAKIQHLIDNHIYYFLEEYKIMPNGFINNLKKYNKEGVL
ncbi:MAG TPA: hypothetical protein PL063_01840 [Candidatus Cloacimonadota bacterium]|nr:hypothetical protein [Candidatus Cloacimonadota bacterium]HPK40687.1 hypothetical protein [Candidatus Cloacimonadota bacterium]HPY95935.1 hypothetical protein [Candidatus Cloacimonadota bacterium]HQB41926.1 hypothetical protein [Candidatus Cloacimonadota bacterium]